MTVDSLLLLPGLDGTGTLFADLIAELPATLGITVAKYPTDRFLCYSELAACVRDTFPNIPFVMVAESFSTPLAVKLAATHPPNLAGLVLCAGFVTNPLRGRSLVVRTIASPWLFQLSPPDFALQYFLIGADASARLRAAVRHALRLVKPGVLVERVRAVLDCDAREDLARTQIPMIYIQAHDDRLVRPECYREIQQLRPDTVLVTVPGPHLVFQRQPSGTAETVVKFIRQLPG